MLCYALHSPRVARAREPPAPVPPCARILTRLARRAQNEREKDAKAQELRDTAVRLAEAEAAGGRARDEVSALLAEKEELEGIAQQVHAVTGRMMPGALPPPSPGGSPSSAGALFGFS